MKRAILDIETVPARELIGGTAEEIKKASLNALTGRIACIGLLLVDDFRFVDGVAIASSNEGGLLKDFWKYVETHRISKFVTHNGLSFDLPFIWKRCIINRVKPSLDFDLRKFRTDFVYDTMAIWANWDTRMSPKLADLSEALGLGTKVGSADDVHAKWNRRDFDAIAKYCIHDCWLTYACYCRMNFVDPTPQECCVSACLMQTERSETTLSSVSLDSAASVHS